MKKLISLALSGMFLSGLSYGQSKKAKFTSEIGLLSYTNHKSKPDGGTETSKNSVVSTPNNLLLGVWWDSFGVYVMPESTGGEVAFSYVLSPAIELGLGLGVNNNEEKTGANKTTTVQNQVRLYGIHYLTLMPSVTLESTLSLTVATNKSDTTTPDSNTSTSTTSRTVSINLAFLYQMTDNLYYIGGPAYSAGNQEDQDSNKSSLSTLTVNFLGFRYLLP